MLRKFLHLAAPWNWPLILTCIQWPDDTTWPLSSECHPWPPNPLLVLHKPLSCLCRVFANLCLLRWRWLEVSVSVERLDWRLGVWFQICAWRGESAWIWIWIKQKFEKKSFEIGTTLVRPKNKNVHRFTHNLHGIKITMAESYPWNISAWCVIVFE